MTSPVCFLRLLILLVFTSLISCKKPSSTKVNRAFYYWKNTEYTINDSEEVYLKNLSIQKMYVKFFEVQADPLFGTKPFAKTDLHVWRYSLDNQLKADTALVKVMQNLEIIPTVFIKNEVFKQARKGSLDTLADNVFFLITKYYKDRINNRTIEFDEIQIDCDWTLKTKNNYFAFLKALKKISDKTISCTLRLYPYKYPEIMGTPPVDKATLMCYNLTKPLESENKNSILDNEELKSYLKNSKKYPIHLDIALPLFSMMYIYQNGQFSGTINPNKVNIKPNLKQVKPMWFELISDFETENMFLREGDLVKLEEVSKEQIAETINLLKKHLKLDEYTTIALFHLDDNNLKQYDTKTLASFYNSFTK